MRHRTFKLVSTEHSALRGVWFLQPQGGAEASEEKLVVRPFGTAGRVLPLGDEGLHPLLTNLQR
jgi:hypothetical protein